jgi:hypothetical protein
MYFFAILKVTGENSRIWSRIRIRYSEVRVRESGSVAKCHGSRNTVWNVWTCECLSCRVVDPH